MRSYGCSSTSWSDRALSLALTTGGRRRVHSVANPGRIEHQALDRRGVLQYVDQGAITLDTLAYTLLDKVVQPQCGSTMVSPP